MLSVSFNLFYVCFFISADVLKKEWGKLRDNYRKTLSKREKATRSGAGNKKALPACNFFAELSFLRDSMVNRSSVSNIPETILTPMVSPSASSTLAEDDIAEVERHTSSHTTTQPIHSGTIPAPPKRKRRSNSNEEQADVLLAQALDRHLNAEEQQNPQEEDDDRLFCLSLVKTLKKLNERKNAQARIKIQTILYELQFDD